MISSSPFFLLEDDADGVVSNSDVFTINMYKGEPGKIS
jgi:hypothetical protein